MSEIFPIRNIWHAASSIWPYTEPEFRLCWLKLCSSNNHYTTAQMLLKCCLLHIDMTLLRGRLYFVCLCPCLCLGLLIIWSISIIIFIFIGINHILSLKLPTCLFGHFCQKFIFRVFQAFFSVANCLNYPITNYVKFPVFKFFERVNKGELKMVNIKYQKIAHFITLSFH